MLEAMLAALALAVLVAGGTALGPPVPAAVPAVPPEPDAFMLPEAPTYQAVVADLEGDGARELVRLIASERGSILAEAWRQDSDAWSPAGTVAVVPSRPTGAQADVVYAGAPVRMLVRRVEDRDHVTLVRQPRFEEPDLRGECCMLLDDLVLIDGQLRLSSVSTAGDASDAILVVDLDGDGTDELVSTRASRASGDAADSTAARVHRWSGSDFEPPEVTLLPMAPIVPFVLGDSDGIPGDELAFLPVLPPSSLHRLSLTGGDGLRSEDSGLAARDAIAVPIGDARGVAVATAEGTVSVSSWPADEGVEPAAGEAAVEEATLLGVVSLLDRPRLLVRKATNDTLHVLDLPGLGAPGFSITRSPASATFASDLLEPYVGPLPGGGQGGETAIVYLGRLMPADDLPGAPFPTGDAAVIGTLAGVEPVGLLGRGRSWMALLHRPLDMERVDPSGGPLTPPVLQPGSGVSLAPVEALREPELDDAELDPPVRDAPSLDDRGTLAVGPDGFTALIEAPPGTRIYLAEADPSVLAGVRIVPAGGRLNVTVVPAPPATANLRQRVTMALATPAGHGYLASWEVRLLTDPPRVTATAATDFGAPSVTVTGRAAPYAAIRVNGVPVDAGDDGSFRTRVDAPPWPTEVEVIATDPLGNETRLPLTGVGILDYRALPWIPIAVGLVAAAGVVLFLRVPTLRPVQRRAEDDAVLEEIDPD